MPSGISTSIFFRLCARAPKNRSTRFGFTARRAPRRRHLQLAAQIARRSASRCRRAAAAGSVPSKTICPPFSPAPGPRSTMWSAARITSGSCSTTTIVLPRSRSSSRMRISRAGVAAVQPDGRLVEHVAGAHQPRAEAGGKLDALRLAARKRGRKPVERQILQAHVVQELQPLPDLDQNLVGDRRLLRAQVPALSKNCCASRDVHPHDVGDGSCRPPARTALPCAAARRLQSGQSA